MRVACALLAAALVSRAAGAVEVSGRCAAEALQALSLDCSETEPCPLFLELAAAEASGNRLFVTGNVHTGSATLESVLLMSEDGGKTWTDAHPRIPFAVLDQIQFFDFEIGWVTGHVLQGVPRDAFLLLTTDGGKTWRKRPVAGESRTGAIDQLWFDSRTHGMLTLDRVRGGESGLRYEIWESMTGGEGWSVRQVNHEPLTIRRPERTSLWRIRPDGAAKAHRIERLEAGKWTAVASFNVAAGECRVPDPQLADTPPPETSASEAAPGRPPTPRKPPSLKH